MSTKNPHIAVAIPPIEDFYSTPHRISSLGTQIVADLLRNAGFRVTVFNALSDPHKKRQIPLPHSLSHLSLFLIKGETGRCSYFTRYQHFGEEISLLARQILDSNPALCFIGCFAFCYAGQTLALAEELKKLSPDLIIIAGGAGTSVNPDYFLRNASIDYTLSGEAETYIVPFMHLITARSGSPDAVPGLGWKTGGEFRHSPKSLRTGPESVIPVLSRTGETAHSVFYTASVSRGCNSACRFCANHLVHGRPFRHASPGLFSEYIGKLPAVPPGKTVRINFEDDNLLCDMPFFREIMHICRERFPLVRFTAENGADYRLLNEELCSELIDAGFIQFNFTLGSLSREVLERESRIGSTERFTSLLALCASRNIPVISYLICGFPDDIRESVAESFRFLTSQPTTIGISLFYPVPGLPGFRDPSLFDSHPPRLCCGSSAYPWNGSLSTETLVTAFRTARIINCMKMNDATPGEREVIARTTGTGSLHTIVKEKGYRRVVEVPHQDRELVRMVFR